MYTLKTKFRFQNNTFSKATALRSLVATFKNSLTTFLTIGLTVLLCTPAEAIVFDMATLEFSNRAACANFSTSPTRSMFLQIDAYNAGRAGYAQGLAQQRSDSAIDPNATSSRAVKDFRLWVTRLTVDIAQALLKGQLPLLPPDASAPELFNKTVASCLNKNQLLSCPGMNDFLSDIWMRSKMSAPRWEQLGFQPSDFFPPELREHSDTAGVGCHIIRKFSGLQSHLKSQVVTDGIIDQIARDSFIPETHMDSCFASNEGKDPRFTSVQIDIAKLVKQEDWDKLGFPFWHSLKLFLSWAWRNAPEYQMEFAKLETDFPSLALEDSIMLLANGCRSMEMPRCDSAGLASDTMRAAKFLGSAHPAAGVVPFKPIDALFTSQGPQAVNDDVLGVFSAKDASAWSRDFKKKLSSLRSVMMKRLNLGLAKLRVITVLVDADTLSQDIKTILEDPNYDKVETYLACMEFTLAKNEYYNDIDLEILNLKDQPEELSSVLLADSGKDIQKFVKYYQTLTATMGPFCRTLEKRGRMNFSTRGLFNSMNEWAFDTMRPLLRNTYDARCITNPNQPACPQNLDKKYLMTKPVQSGAKDVTICKTSLECARTVLDSVISVVSVRRYAHAFLPLDEVIRSPQLFNTYATPTACKLYDPWSKQRNAWKLFVADLGSSLISGASCGSFKFQVNEMPNKKVIAYKEILENNQSTYDPKIETEPLKYTAGIDYAFLPGFSCGVAVANYATSSQQYNYLPGYFSSFRVRACKDSSEVQYILNKHALLDPASKRLLQDKNVDVTNLCFSCQVEFSALTKYSCVASPLVGLAVGAAIGVFEGTIRLISNLSDQDNIPRSEKLNVDQISQSFSDKKALTPECREQLKDGETCD